MGMSVSTSRLQLQVGLDKPEELKKYQELKKETKEKLGTKFTTEHDKICSILAKDPNATVADVESMYKNIQQNGICGASGNNKTQRLQAFQRALKNVPGYRNAKLSSENLKELLNIYNNSFSAQISGKNQKETFNIDAEDYIKNLNKPKIDSEMIGKLKDDINKIKDDIDKSEGIFQAYSESAGAEQISNLNKLNLHINIKRKLFN